jgi:hypothetical protein
MSRITTMATTLMLLVGLLAALAFLAGVQGQAQALASHPPDAVLKKGDGAFQDGLLITYCWDGKCVDLFSSKYSAAERVSAGSRLHIRLSENRRPDRFSLQSRTSPDGRFRRVDTTLRCVERDGKTVAWKIFFRVDRPDRHYYLDAFGIWNHTGGREGGNAYWQFHVKTRS